MSLLEISALRAAVDGKPILRGIDLVIEPGEVHAVMGPNGSGKSTLSHVLMGRPGYEVTGGTVALNGADLLSMRVWERAQAGLFLAMQYPTEIEGVQLTEVLKQSAIANGRDTVAPAARLESEIVTLGISASHLARGVNVDMSGGEKKRFETLQLVALQPQIAILDEIDSGLDVDGLQLVANRIRQATTEQGLSVLVITHYSRVLDILLPDAVHVLADGVIQESGGPELAAELEDTGYDRWIKPIETGVAISGPASSGGDPFADPLA